MRLLYVALQNQIMPIKFRKFVLKSYPSKDFPQDLSCFELVDTGLIDDTVVPEGFAIIKIYWVSSDPLLRTWISGAKSYLDPVKPGSSIPGFGLAKVLKITRKKGKKTIVDTGDWVVGMLEWSEYMLVDYSIIQKLPLDLGPDMYKFLTIHGPTGFTSFWSIKREIIPFQIKHKIENRPKTKQEMTIVISSVAGGIGLTVTQFLSKLGYTRVFGIAGTQEKCRVAEKLGCKGTINYKKYYKGGEFQSPAFERDLKQLIGGEEIDIYYENVGEDMLTAMLNLMADHSKIVMCGATATYNSWGQKAGIKNMEKVISKRILMKGILYYNIDFNQRVATFMEMGALGIQGADVVIKGMENLPTVYRDMIAGKFIGKPVVQLVDHVEQAEE